MIRGSESRLCHAGAVLALCAAVVQAQQGAASDAVRAAGPDVPVARVDGAARPKHDARATQADFGSRAAYQRALGLREATRGKVFGARLEPHWLDGARLWFRRDARDGREFVLADAERSALAPAFDHAALARALAAATGAEVDARRLPFDAIRLADDGAVGFDHDGSAWRFDPGAGACERTGRAAPAERPARGRRGGRGPRAAGATRGSGEGAELASPDGAWRALVRDHDLWLRAADGGERRLTEDGSAELHFAPAAFSPDSTRLVAWRVKPGAERLVHYVESSPRDQVQPRHSTREYLKPGDDVTIRKPVLFDVASGARTEIDDALFAQPYQTARLRWRDDGAAFTFEYNERGHQVYRVLEVDAASGSVRALIEESCTTFFDYNHKYHRSDLDGGAEILWMSERDGWNHLWLFDGRSGAVRAQVTRGEWIVRSVEHVDEAMREVWFTGSGRNAGEDPYHVHWYRAGFDGGEPIALTDGDGTHEVVLSPDRRFLVDTWSRVDKAPVHELRRTSDGSLVCRLGEADVEDLLATGWRWPQPFAAKGRDGTTDIWGVIYRPIGFDPTLAYPVVESIYAGPQGSFVPKGFAEQREPQALAELGFVVVQIDGMGTSNRSRAFHHFCHRNLADAGLPDRIAWLRAAAGQFPGLDLERVGIYGTSAGAQSAAGAVFDHGDFYKVAVAACGCHDNRMDKLWWNEMWMGWPVGPHYAEQSNVTKAHKLTGKLQLVVGELDTNVDPASTMQVVDALIRADKDFDLIVLPGAGHTDGGAYGRRRRWDFFVRHLHGVEPRHDGG